MLTHITCRECFEHLPVDCFAKSGTTRTGYAGICTECASKGFVKVEGVDANQKRWGLLIPQEDDLINIAWKDAIAATGKDFSDNVVTGTRKVIVANHRRRWQ